MSSSDTLLHAKPCRRCGQEIPPGTPLSTLDWGREERAWAHWKPTCEEARKAAPTASSGVPQALPEGSTPAEVAQSGSGHPNGSASLLDEPTAGSWSVTVELHEAVDPAESKRVIRIARLHLRTLKEAREIAERLRGDL